MHPSCTFFLLFAIYHWAVNALPQIRTIETAFTTIITAKDKSITKRISSTPISQSLLHRENRFESEISVVNSAIFKDCTRVESSQEVQVFSCASAFVSLLEDLGLFSEPIATTVFSTETVIPVQATGVQRREVLTLGDEVFTVAGLVSSLNLGTIEPGTAPTPDITLFKPHAVASLGLIATEINGQPIQAIARRGSEDKSAVDIPTFTALSPGKHPISSQNSLATITARQDVATPTLIGCGIAPGGLITCAQTTFSNCVGSEGDQTCNGQIPLPTSTTSEVQSFLRVVPTTLQKGGDIITTYLISGLFRTTLQARASLATEVPNASREDFNSDDK
ncbi:uncharacterized protein EAE97_010688 [Botrytis byssoidea]|uniref:Uncharacterized protein n=1 Tax=Botrytis byssoidea TaxID=139641 RepID=A0A9P5HYU5_9HELO|nr:uncharacterized protein EAE97_010688 [Botrytis byssoidea]KAF7924737.1 hypothetical protein EAE97_010688 [Botrytis byssoidea]